MPEQPVTFRPVSAESRTLLEAVAQFEGVSLARYVAVAIDDYVREHIARVGADKIAEANRAARAKKHDELKRLDDLGEQLEALLHRAGVQDD